MSPQNEISLVKTMNMISTDNHDELVFALCHATIDKALIVMVYVVYNIRALTGETTILLLDIVIHSKRGS